jgi:hypothetical protein
MYSDLPFLNRTKRTLDKFGGAAIAHAKQQPDAPYIANELRNGARVMRYAGVMFMERSWVDCHNIHADSPAPDWRVGDVRGVLEVTQR